MKFKSEWGFNDEVEDKDFIEKYVAGYPDHGAGELEQMRSEIDRLTEITGKIFSRLSPYAIKGILSEEGYKEVEGGE